MKKFFRLASLCALLLGLAVSCDPEPEPEPLKLDTPTGLSSSDVTTAGATLKWNAVKNAGGYNVQIGDNTPIPVTGITHLASGLDADTEYKWKVQAVKDDTKSGWSTEATFKTEAATVIIPAATELAVGDVTHEGATLTWQHNDADSHEVVIGDNEAVTVTEPAYTATGLDPETGYTWKVRSAKDGAWSEWVDGEQFETRILFPYLFPFYGEEDNVAWWGDEEYGEGTNQFIINFVSIDPNDDIDDVGYDFAFELVTGPVDTTGDMIDLPEGTYNFSETPGVNTIVLNGSYTMLIMTDFSWFGQIQSGTMTIEGDHTGYKIDIDLILADREFHATWLGPIDILNDWVPAPADGI